MTTKFYSKYKNQVHQVEDEDTIFIDKRPVKKFRKDDFRIGKKPQSWSPNFR
ncbi:MAG: hypothetical protein HYV28_04880 [Ignavibacteriales bacterium]|nr:hypothetical protein [Ignavibacteriales bacterium]